MLVARHTVKGAHVGPERGGVGTSSARELGHTDAQGCCPSLGDGGGQQGPGSWSRDSEQSLPHSQARVNPSGHRTWFTGRRELLGLRTGQEWGRRCHPKTCHSARGLFGVKGI